MLAYKYTLVWFTLVGGIVIMKDLLDFVALGKELGYSGDKLEGYAEAKYGEYLRAEERKNKDAYEYLKAEEQKNKDAYERELRLLERKAKIAEDERSAAESSGAGVLVLPLMYQHLDLLLLMINQMT